ncbi:potassium/proton antiporter [Cyanobacterium aponinum AL20118]|uniref:Potassium/proton antiporter n=1 Tax=Cyanobacterium aponinum AL20115 TaxID=3090662 RepID=A0AAF1C270_9CHRO|nr:potassium/proton antiporter [Cyanobacterium aponinum]WPF89407.1 potassium/proton antiporter [Cyanobacterium aponinum AL20115]WRL38350.1 potassium/proton antiporter [Cyanobacterium aponinum UTEX 3221]
MNLSYLSIEELFLIFGILILASVFASKIASRLGVPALLLFLLIGILSGSQGVGGIDFESYGVSQYVADSALVIILFSGGLDTKWRQIRPIIKEGLLLSTLGVCITAVLVGSFAWLILGSFSSFNLGVNGISWTEGLLLGAIVSSTDAAAVFSVLKSSNIRLKNNLQPLLELESGSNDPTAILLATSIIGVLAQGVFNPTVIIFSLLLQILIGSFFGYYGGLLMVWVINRIQLASDGLYPVCAFGLLLMIFSITAFARGNPFLAVYIIGIVFSNSNVLKKELIISFHDGLSWLMEITMFLTLGLLVFPSDLLSNISVGIAIALFLILIARPISVFLCLAPFSKYKQADKLFVSWVGLRGAVPIVLSIMPITQGFEYADQIFNLVFFLVIISVLIQGLSLTPMARFLKVID